jgi:membrane-bound ClpP family serine protease
MSGGELIGTLGVSLLLLAFVFNVLKRMPVNSFWYLILNIVGAALAGVSSYMIKFWPFVVLESVWMLSSIIILIKNRRHA